MNWLHKIYPLRLREKIYFHLIARANSSPKKNGAFYLEFAPVKMKSLLSTDYGHRQIAWIGFYELDLSRKISSLAREGGLMVDVGANAGYFTCLWASLNPHNEVYSFEPSPRNLSMMRQNISALNDPKQVQVFDHAIGKEIGMLDFDVGPEDQTGWGGLAESVSARTIQVNVRRLDEVIPVDKDISVLKIDTEGADTWVLYGAEKILRSKRVKHIFFEANLARMRLLGIHAGDAEKYLTSLGYSVQSLGADEFYAAPQ